MSSPIILAGGAGKDTHLLEGLPNDNQAPVFLGNEAFSDYRTTHSLTLSKIRFAVHAVPNFLTRDTIGDRIVADIFVNVTRCTNK